MKILICLVIACATGVGCFASLRLSVRRIQDTLKQWGILRAHVPALPIPRGPLTAAIVIGTGFWTATVTLGTLLIQAMSRRPDWEGFLTWIFINLITQACMLGVIAARHIHIIQRTPGRLS